MTSRPPSFPPARAAARPDLEELGAPRAPRDRAERFASEPSPTRRRALRGLVVLIGIVAILAASHFSGLAPWVRSIPAATALDPGLEQAMERAIAAAAEDGVELRITSGLRSAGEQQALWNDAVDQYGGPHEAARWVLPPEHSEHVQGRAVDVGPLDGALWLATNGARWGLCQIFANEPWHFERVTEDGGTCPELLPDASYLLDLG